MYMIPTRVMNSNEKSLIAERTVMTLVVSFTLRLFTRPTSTVKRDRGTD